MVFGAKHNFHGRGWMDRRGLQETTYGAFAESVSAQKSVAFAVGAGPYACPSSQTHVLAFFNALCVLFKVTPVR